MYKPGYLKLYKTGELKKRLHLLESNLSSCIICPRSCKVNRIEDKHGFCKSGYLPYISSIMPHHGEERILSGINGSGTLFFGSCNLRCIYCQNWQISQDQTYFKSTISEFQWAARSIVDLQDREAVHNINFVSPSHFVPQLVRIIYEAVPLGLHIPIVYNSNGYDSPSTLHLLDGIIDIYMPDFKYAEDSEAVRYSRCNGYSVFAKQAIKEMFRQVGLLQIDKFGIATKGLLVRHLVLPNGVAGSSAVFNWLAKNLDKRVAVSLLAQYNPDYQAHLAPQLSRTITGDEYKEARNALTEAGLSTEFCQV